MIKLPLKALFIGFVLCLAPGALAQDDPGLEDLSGIPVMDGLTEDLSQRVVFDKPEGRIIRTLLTGNVTPGQATGFYSEALFQLGWKLTKSDETLVFTRDEEQLTLALSGEGPVEIVLSLRPLS